MMKRVVSETFDRVGMCGTALVLLFLIRTEFTIHLKGKIAFVVFMFEDNQ